MTNEQFPQNNEERVEWLRSRGSSLMLSWGEDTGLWEVSWITGGKRYSHTSNDLGRALFQVYRYAGTDTSLETERAMLYAVEEPTRAQWERLHELDIMLGY